MSGTSLDGVDAALVQTDGERILGFGRTGYRPYSQGEAATIRAALGHWPDEDGVAAATAVVEAAHLAVLKGFEGADLIGFHGQTLAHEPRGRGTHQAGDGARLADTLGLPVAWDFRTGDVAAGGQGAPLAPFYHHACARHIGATAPLVFLNLGGVGNVTWTDPRMDAPEAPGAVLAFDTGPANAPINDLMLARRGLARDDGGALAAQGRVNETIVSTFLDDPYVAAPPPKSLDRQFPDLLDAVAALSDEDATATVLAAAVACVARAFDHFPSAPDRVLVTGGGRHNATFMAALARALPCPVVPVEAAGLDGDMLEAQAFAYLAVRVARGLPLSAPGTTGVALPVTGGRISRP